MQAWVIGNWKQNPATSDDVNALLNDLCAAISTTKQISHNNSTRCHIMVAPSFLHLAAVSRRLNDTSVLCAAQDVSSNSASVGAYTGECSAQQVADAGATWTILGHSERRQYHNESNDTLLQKTTHALSQNLGVVFCIGETQVQYDAKQTLTVIDNQLAVVKELMAQQPELIDELSTRLIIAYEPVWAIGTGKVPTVAEVSLTHRHIKQTLAEFADSLSNMTVLYGGSVNADNADSFAADPMIDGALVGGASLKAESFLAIATAFNKGSI